MIYSKFIKFFLYFIPSINLVIPSVNLVIPSISLITSSINANTNTHSLSNNYNEDENTEANLKNDLLENYNLVIPSSNHKITIYLDVEFLSLKQVDQVNNIITSSITLNYKWKDEYLQWDPGKYQNITYTTFSNNAEFDDAIWTPDIYIKNTAEKALDQLPETKILVDYEGNVYWSRPGIVDTNCEFDLSNFPYDVQKCYFLFSSYSNDINQLTFNYINPKINIDNILKIEEWDIDNKPNTEILVKRSGFFKRDFSNIKFNINLERRPAFYEFNIIMPTFLTASLIIASMFIPWKSGERISFSVTVMLSVLVFLLLLSDILPKTDKNPFLSNILLALTILCMFVVIFTIIESIAYYKSKKILPKKLQKMYFNYLICRHKIYLYYYRIRQYYCIRHKGNNNFKNNNFYNDGSNNNIGNTSYNDDNLINSNINIAIYLDELNKKNLNNNNNPNHNPNHNPNNNPNPNYFNNRNYSNDEINCDSKSRLLPRSISNVNFMTSKYLSNEKFNYFKQGRGNTNTHTNANTNTTTNTNANTNTTTNTNTNANTNTNTRKPIKKYKSITSMNYYSSDSIDQFNPYSPTITNNNTQINNTNKQTNNTDDNTDDNIFNLTKIRSRYSSSGSSNDGYLEVSSSSDDFINKDNNNDNISNNSSNDSNNSSNDSNNIINLDTIIDLPESMIYRSKRFPKLSRKKKHNEINENIKLIELNKINNNTNSNKSNNVINVNKIKNNSIHNIENSNNEPYLKENTTTKEEENTTKEEEQERERKEDNVKEKEKDDVKEKEKDETDEEEDEEDEEEDEEDEDEEDEDEEDEEEEDEEDKKIKEEFISNMYSRNRYLLNNNISETQFTEKIKEEIKRQEKKDYNDFIKLVRSIKVFTFSIIFISFGIVILSQRK